jgi:hypothetical protein
LGTYSVTAPKLAFTAYNSTTNTITGSSTKNQPYTISRMHWNLDAGNTYTQKIITGTIPATGLWSVKFGAPKFHGGDVFLMTVTSNSAFQFELNFTIPHIHCYLGANTCFLIGLPRKPATLSIVHRKKTYTFTGMFNSASLFFVSSHQVGVEQNWKSE